MSIAKPLLAWFARHGRHDLPWLENINPYRVWLSEIMLQQTQVSTVIPYFERFTKRLPTVELLAAAELDQVLHLWTGLGYYARARHLHRTAIAVTEQHAGIFPDELEELVKLPGIGRSTAAAILAISMQKTATILDGNVKRVLARMYAIEAWPGNKKVEQTLWELAELNTPKKNVADYTQAIMDLGATVCVRSKPVCEECPLATVCAANKQSQQHLYPGKKPKKTLAVKQAVFVIILNAEQQILLQQRPAPGLWGGLWCLPEFQTSRECEQWLAENFTLAKKKFETLSPLRHTFSHFHLDITPVMVNATARHNTIHDRADYLWYSPAMGREIGMAAPVLRLLKKYTTI